MKQSIKKELKAKRDDAVFKDFCRMYKSGYRPDVIYDKLSDKYFITEGWVYRIILKKSGISNGNQARGDP